MEFLVFLNDSFQVHFVSKLPYVLFFKISLNTVPILSKFLNLYVVGLGIFSNTKANLFETLLCGFEHFFWDKNLHYYAKSQSREKCLFYFGLRMLTAIRLSPLFKISTFDSPYSQQLCLRRWYFLQLYVENRRRKLPDHFEHWSHCSAGIRRSYILTAPAPGPL